MRTLLLILVATLPGFCWAQGTIGFSNYQPVPWPGYDGRISYAAGGPVPAGYVDGTTTVLPIDGYFWGGINATAGLYYGPMGTSADQLALLATTTFRAGGVLNRTGVPDPYPSGTRATFQLRAWDCGLAGVGSYEDALAISATRPVYYGASGTFDLTLTDGMVYLEGLQPFTIAYVPEPSTFTLLLDGSLGIISALYRRKR